MTRLTPPIRLVARSLTAGLLAVGLALTGVQSASAADTVDPTGLPDHIVNGDFSSQWDTIYQAWLDSGDRGFKHMANVDYEHGEAGGAWDIYATPIKQTWTPIPGFDPAAFAWKSDQTDTRIDGRAPIVELRDEGQEGNPYAEITASQKNTYIYQDINTTSDTPVVYTIRLKHASRLADSPHDAMSVMIGPPGQEKPVPLTRTASMSGDTVGETSDVLRSTGMGWEKQWDTYEGSLIIPAYQPVTRFTFKAVDSPTDTEGNLVDDITFAKAYPLTYESNGGTGKVPSHSEAGKLEDVN